MSKLRKLFPWVAALGAVTAIANAVTEALKARREKRAAAKEAATP